MPIIRKFAAVALGAMLCGSAACARNSQGASAGDVLPSYDTYSNSALLHITNNLLGGVEVFTTAQGTRDYLGVASSIGPTNLVVDPSIVPNANLYITLRASTGETKVLGPFVVKRGTVLDVKIPSTLRGALVSEH